MKKLESNMGVLMASISVSFAIFMVGIVQTGGRQALFCTVGFGLLCFTIWYYKDMQKKIDIEESNQRQIEKTRHEELIATLKGLRGDLKK